MDFHETKPWNNSPAFTAAYFPSITESESLINFPMRNGRNIFIGLSFIIPAAINNGVVGSGNKE